MEPVKEHSIPSPPVVIADKTVCLFFKVWLYGLISEGDRSRMPPLKKCSFLNNNFETTANIDTNPNSGQGMHYINNNQVNVLMFVFDMLDLFASYSVWCNYHGMSPHAATLFISVLNAAQVQTTSYPLLRLERTIVFYHVSLIECITQHYLCPSKTRCGLPIRVQNILANCVLNPVMLYLMNIYLFKNEIKTNFRIFCSL